MLPVTGWPPRCLLRAATGVPCPFCGMTTGVLATLHGDVAAAFAANPAAPVFVAGVVLAAIGWRARVVAAVGRWRWPALGALWAFQLLR